MDINKRKYHVTMRMKLEPSASGAWQEGNFGQVKTEGSVISATLLVEAVNEQTAEFIASHAMRTIAPHYCGSGLRYGTWETLACVAEDEDTTRSSDDAHASGC